MTQMDNESSILSRHVSTLDVALHEYALAPRQGLEKLQEALLALQKIPLSAINNTVFYQQLAIFSDAVDALLASGAVYSKDHQLAFLEAVDALLQFAIASQFDAERSQQLVVLLSPERSCWQVLQRIPTDQYFPHDVTYEAQWMGGDREAYHQVDPYLTQFAALGKVSFRLDSVHDSKLRGRFSLTSAQSLVWLKQRFPMFHWELAADVHSGSLKDLFELIYLLFFQHTVLGRQSRQRLLGVMEQQAKTLFYRRFGSLFPSDRGKDIEDFERLIPQVSYPSPLVFDRSLRVFPVRDGGVFYAALRDDWQSKTLGAFKYFHRLERDIVSSFLYVVETAFGSFAFDQAECLGVYAVSRDDFQLSGQTLYFTSQSRVMAQLLLSMPLSSQKESPFCCLIADVVNVLIVGQIGRYFALPYFAIHEEEGICALARNKGKGVKNVWMRLSGAPLLEPWLQQTYVSDGASLLPIKNKSTTFYKSGYYLGKVDGVTFCIDAALVADLLPYNPHHGYTCFNSQGISYHHFMLHDGVCFFKILPIPVIDESQGRSLEKNRFSVVLESLGESVWLNLCSCDWQASPPEREYIDEFDLLLGASQYESKSDVFAFLRGKDVLINNENYLSFVASFFGHSRH